MRVDLLLAATTQQRLGIALVVVLVLAWIGYVIVQLGRSPAPPGAEIELAPNRKPYFEDDVLEGPRLSRYLGWALVLLTISAVGLPLYWAKEPSRQEGAARGFASRAEHRGRSLSLPTNSPEHGAHFGCENCHGAGLKGGAATYTITDYLGRQSQVSWLAPDLTTVLSRFDPEELQRILVYGRPNTPMPAWGVEGGGPMNAQQITDLVAYIESIQLPADEVKQKAAEVGTDGAVLFDSYCARCHTKGWSYGQPEVQGGGAFGPSLIGGRTLRQFPDLQAMIDFITEGSEFEKPYGVNGIGSGRMPGFGDRGEAEDHVTGELTEAQIRAIVEYERSL